MQIAEIEKQRQEMREAVRSGPTDDELAAAHAASVVAEATLSEAAAIAEAAAALEKVEAARAAAESLRAAAEVDDTANADADADGDAAEAADSEPACTCSADTCATGAGPCRYDGRVGVADSTVAICTPYNSGTGTCHKVPGSRVTVTDCCRGNAVVHRGEDAPDAGTAAPDDKRSAMGMVPGGETGEAEADALLQQQRANQEGDEAATLALGLRAPEQEATDRGSPGLAHDAATGGGGGGGGSERAPGEEQQGEDPAAVARRMAEAELALIESRLGEIDQISQHAAAAATEEPLGGGGDAGPDQAVDADSHMHIRDEAGTRSAHQVCHLCWLRSTSLFEFWLGVAPLFKFGHGLHHCSSKVVAG
jgi:hypothetical protein